MIHKTEKPNVKKQQKNKENSQKKLNLNKNEKGKNLSEDKKVEQTQLKSGNKKPIVKQEEKVKQSKVFNNNLGKNEKKEVVEKKLENAQTQVEKADDSCTLFLKSLPNEVTEDEIKSLSSDIKNVRIKASSKKTGKQPPFAFIEFENEEITEKNFNQIKNKKIRNQEIYVDYVGNKSSYVKPEAPTKQKGKTKDMTKLHIGGVDKNASENDLKKIFKNCKTLTLPRKNESKLNHGFAFVTYSTKEETKKALDSLNGTEFNGKRLKIDYAFIKDDSAKKKETVVKTDEPASKKLKNGKGEQVVKKEEEKKKEAPATKMNGKAKQEENKNGKRKLEEEDEDEDDEDDDDEMETDEDEDDEEEDDEDEDDDDEDDDDDDDDDEDDDDEEDEDVDDQEGEEDDDDDE